jgi:DNA-directed RNA polymerase beta' subunit
MGAEAVQDLLKDIDLEAEISRLREEIPNTTSETKLKKASKRFEVDGSVQRVKQQARMDGDECTSSTST